MSHGGRRAGAGRPAGSGWRPAITEMRVAAQEQMAEIVGSYRDPLAVVLAVACDERQDTQTRLGAAAIALPYLYPKLSATTVSSTHFTAKIDPSELMDRLAERIARMSTPGTIEHEPPTEADAA